MDTATQIGPPRARNGRLRIDVGRARALRAEGYSLGQIGMALGVSTATIRDRLKEPPDPYYSALGKKGQGAKRRAMARRKRKAKAEAALEAKRQRAAQAQGVLLRLGLLALVADRIVPHDDRRPEYDLPGR